MTIYDKPDILDTLFNEDIELKKRGRYFWSLCPFHSERTPSFKVDPDRQNFYCFGCHVGGDTFSFIQQYHNLSFPDTLSYLGIEKNRKHIKPDPVQIRKRALRRIYEQWKHAYTLYLADLLRMTDKAAALCRDMEQVESMAEIYHKLSTWQYEFDLLMGNDEQAKLDLFKGVRNGKNNRRAA